MIFLRTQRDPGWESNINLITESRLKTRNASIWSKSFTEFHGKMEGHCKKDGIRAMSEHYLLMLHDQLLRNILFKNVIECPYNNPQMLQIVQRCFKLSHWFVAAYCTLRDVSTSKLIYSLSILEQWMPNSNLEVKIVIICCDFQVIMFAVATMFSCENVYHNNCMQ